MFTIIDLTQTLSAASMTYPGTVPAWTAERLDIGNPNATVSRFSGFDPHCGTHIDAPLHFAPGGSDAASLPLRLHPVLVVPIDGPRVDTTSIPVDCEGRAVLFLTGWEGRAGTREYYERFPVITGNAAQLLVDRGAALVGLDTPSADGTEEHPAYPAHQILCGAGVPIVEGLVNLRALLSVAGEVLFAAFPLKLSGIEGSPVRAVALVRE